MASNTDTARAVIDIDGKQAEVELEKLKEDAKELRVLLRQAQETNDLAGYKKLEAQLKANAAAQKQFKKAVFDVDNVLKNLNGSTLRELNKAYATLNTRMKDAKHSTDDERASYAKLQSDMVAIDAQRKKLTAGIRDHEKSTSSLGISVRSLWGGIGQLAAGLGIATGAFEIAKGVVNATDTVSDKFEETLGGIKSGLNYFAIALTNLDFSNFLTNMRAAIKAGKDYVQQIDTINERTRGIAIIEADDAKRIAQLDIISKDVTRTKAERINALKEILGIEQKNANLSVTLAADKANSELKYASQMTGLSQKRIKEMLKENATSYTSVEAAKKYNDALVTLATQRPTGNFIADWILTDKQAIQEAHKYVKSASPELKKNAADLLKLGRINEEQYDRITSALTESGQAQAAYYEDNNKRLTRLSKLNKGILDDEEKDQKKHEKTVITAYEEIDKKISDADKNIKDALAKGNTPLAEKFLLEKKAAEKLKETIDGIQKALELGLSLEDIKKTLESFEKMDSRAAGIFKKDTSDKGIAESVKKGLSVLGDKRAGGAMGPSVDDESREKLEQDAAEAWKQATIDIAVSMNDAIFQITANRQQDEYDQKMNLLEKQREKELSNKNLTEEQKEAINKKYDAKQRKLKQDAFKKQRNADFIQSLINTALGVGRALAAPPGWPYNSAAVLTAGIEGLAQSGIILAQKVPEYGKGRYTVTGDSGKIYKDISYTGPAVTGIYTRPALVSESGKELIIDAPTTRNLQMNYPEIIAAVMAARIPQYAGGRYTSATATASGASGSQTSTMMVDAMNRFADAVDRLEKNGVKGNWVYKDFTDFDEKVKATESRVGL